MAVTDVNMVQPDVTLSLDSDGVIRSASLSRAYSAEKTQGWVGRRWTETVGSDLSGDKVQRMIEDARANGVSAFRQVTQCFPSGLEVPMEYTTVRLGGKAGLVAVGKNLQAVTELQSRLVGAQLAMERDYWKLREVETRYRVLFDASTDAVLLIRPSDMHVVEANPAAIRALGVAPVDRDFLSELPAEERQAFQSMVAAVREHGRAPAVVAHLGPDRAAWTLRASLMTTEPAQVLLQLSRAGPAQPMPGRNEPVPLENFIERAPDAFVVVDRQGIILRSNAAFVDLVEMGSANAVVGERLRRWLSRPGADLPVLLSSVQRNGMVRLFATTIGSELGREASVEISAVGDSDANPDTFGILIRDVTHRLETPGAVSGSSLTLGALTSKIGETPLHDLVRETTDHVERHYIDAALAMTGNNRTAAAELLGLSRQSLYVKLNRYKSDNRPATVQDGE